MEDYHKEYRKKNKDKLKEYQKEYQKRYREKNKNKYNEYQKEYSKEYRKKYFKEVSHYERYKDSIQKCYLKKRDEILAKFREPVLCSCQVVYSRRYYPEHLKKKLSS